MKKFLHIHDIFSIGRLATDAVYGLTDLVEDMHRTVTGVPLDRPARGIPGLVYSSIRGVTDLVSAINGTLAQLFLELEGQSSTRERETILAAVNGVLGDHLAATENSLAIPMSLRQNGQTLELNKPGMAAAFPKPSRKLIVLVHGLCMNDLQWTQQDHNHGEALARDLGFTPVYLHYNSGQHISTNGRAFAEKLDALVKSWPVPVKELVILSHSMGGLVTRSACRAAELEGHTWPAILRKLVFLGTPHHGSPLERAGHWFQSTLATCAYSAPFSRLGKIRSAGITDMRFGSLLDEDWENYDRFALSDDPRQPVPLPEGVQSYAIGAMIRSKTLGPVTDFIGDGLVPVNSALGEHNEPHLNLGLPETHQWIGHKMNHLDLLRKKKVYERIYQWLDGNHR